MRNKAIIIILFILLSGCSGEYAKQFMWEHPEVTFQMTPYDKIYDWRSSNYTLRRCINFYDETIIIYIHEEGYALFLTRHWQKIGKTNYYVRYDLDNNLRFKKMSEQDKLKKEKNKMFLFKWIMIVIMMLIIAKIAHKITLKTIFKPTKKISKHIKKEWDES